MDPFTSIIRALVGGKVAEKAAGNETVRNIASDAKAGAEIVANDVANTAKGAIDWVGSTANKIGNKASRVLSDAAKAGENAFNSALDGYFKIFGLGYKDGRVYSPDVEKAISKAMKKDENSLTSLNEVLAALERDSSSNQQSISENKEDAVTDNSVVEEFNAGTSSNNPVDEKEDESDVVTYTYKPGDTFGQVLLNLGLSDGTNLWGQGGDVDFYTQQLAAQNMLDSLGNVKLGIPFKLRRRK